MDEEEKISSEELERLLQHRRRQEAVEGLRQLSPLLIEQDPPAEAVPVPPAGRILPNQRRAAVARPAVGQVAAPVVATAEQALPPMEDWLRGARPQLRPLQSRRRSRRPAPHPALVAARKGVSWIVDILIYLALVLFILALGFLIYDNVVRPYLERGKRPVVQAEGSPWPVQGWLSSPQEGKPQAPLPFVAYSDTASLRDPYVPVPTPAPGTAMPTRLVIPSIQLDTPVVEVTIVDGVWQTAAYAGGYHRGTARPGTAGNTVISGHKGLDGAVFVRLEEVSVGDEVLLQAGQRLYRYVVAEIKSVWPQQVEVMAQTSKPILTMITCTAFDTQRLVVVAYYDREIVTGVSNSP